MSGTRDALIVPVRVIRSTHLQYGDREISFAGQLVLSGSVGLVNGHWIQPKRDV